LKFSSFRLEWNYSIFEISLCLCFFLTFISYRSFRTTKGWKWCYWCFLKSFRLPHYKYMYEVKLWLTHHWSVSSLPPRSKFSRESLEYLTVEVLGKVQNFRVLECYFIEIQSEIQWRVCLKFLAFCKMVGICFDKTCGIRNYKR